MFRLALVTNEGSTLSWYSLYPYTSSEVQEVLLIIKIATVPIILLPKSYLGVHKSPEFELWVVGNPKVGLGLLGTYISLNDESLRVMPNKS